MVFPDVRPDFPPSVRGSRGRPREAIAQFGPKIGIAIVLGHFRVRHMRKPDTIRNLVRLPVA